MPPTRLPEDDGVRWEQNLQVWLGGLDTSDQWTRDDALTNETLDGDFGTLPYFGGGSQRLWGGRAQIGFEGGGLVAWKNDSTKFFTSNGGVRLEVDNTLFSMEVYMGGVVSLQPTRWFRIYGAVGPAAAYGYLSDDGDDDEVMPASSVELSSSGHAFSMTLYGRTGFEFETASGFTFGAHARYAPHEFDFDDGGTLELDEVQYFVSFGQWL